MGRRFQARRGNGRFARNTMENTFGLSVEVCPWEDCRRFNPRAVGERKAERCHACGRRMDGVADNDGDAAVHTGQ